MTGTSSGGTVDVNKRPDWAAIRADITTVRGGSAPINAAGFALTPSGSAFASAPAGVPRW